MTLIGRLVHSAALSVRPCFWSMAQTGLSSPVARPAASFFTAATSRKNSRIGFAGAPPQRSPGGNVGHHAGRRGDLGAGADLQMSGDAGLSAERGEIADHARSGNAGLRHQNGVTADDDVVADLHEIIDLRAFADHRVAIGAAVDGHAGADLDVVLDDDPADLRHLEMAARRRGRSRSRPGRYGRPDG